jgi:iron(III) transport system substrate-binding protein
MMSFPSARHLTGALVAVALAAIAACTPQPASTQTGDEARVVNVYSGRHYDSDKQIYAAFTAATGIEVRVQEKRGEALLALLEAEGNETPADLIVTVDAGNLYRLQQAGLLQPVTSPALVAAVPARYHEPTGLWWAFSKRARVIAYRNGVVDPATVASMNDLTAPAWRGRLCVRSSENIYNLSMLSARIEREGAPAALAWARGVRANFARDPRGGDSDQLRAIAAGECDAAIVNHYYLLRLAASTDPADQAVAQAVSQHFPDQAPNQPGTHINISGAGISAYAAHKDEAIALLEFLVSPEAQALLAPLNEEFPIRPDAPATPVLAALGTLREENVPLSALGSHQQEAARLFEEAGWR